MTVAGLVLAAGRGERFGGTKQLATLDGRPLVGHAVAAAVAAGLAPVLVVVGHDGDAVARVLPRAVEVVRNPEHEDGQSTSLRAGLVALEGSAADAVVVLLADEPDVAPATVRAVAAELEAGAGLVRTRYRDRPGHPVGLARWHWPVAAGAAGDRGARHLLRGPGTVHVDVGADAPRDVDTPEDLEALRRRV